MVQRVFVDANVLASRTCRDWLFMLRNANEGMFQLHTTYDVLAEAVRAMRKKHPRLHGMVVEDLKVKCEAFIDEVSNDFSGDLPFTGEDIDDYHIHAAAVSSNADMLLTSNSSKDFTSDPDSKCYEVFTPDDFFILIADSNPECMFAVTLEQFEYWGNIKGSKPLDKALANSGCPNFAKRVREELKRIALMP